MGKAYDRVMESRKELTKQLISEMSQGGIMLDQGVEQYGKKTVQSNNKSHL